MEKIYDILIIGGGPAGITAGIYAKRAGKNVAIIERYMPGGQVAQIGEIENYPGFAKINGFDLASKFYSHAQELDVPFLMEEVVKVDLNNKNKVVCTRKNVYKAKVVVLAMGCKTRELNIEGEQKFKGRGVSYCAVCDGNFFKNQNVAVVGSGDSAVGDAIYLAGICEKVYVLTKNEFKVSNYPQNELDKYKNVEILDRAISGKILGSDKVEKLEFEQDEEYKAIDVNAVFVAVGRTPDTAILENQVVLSEKGYIKVDENFMTSCEGVFACGDIVDGSIKQIATATGDGAMVATKAILWLAKN